MPVRKGVGYSTYSTPHKQRALDGLAGFLTASSAHVARKWRGAAVIFDMTCGPGMDEQQRAGSPLIFAKHAQNSIDAGYPVSLVCVDSVATHITALRGWMARLYPAVPVRYATDQRAVFVGMPRNTVGLVYFDPTRYTDLDIDLLRLLGQRFPQLDILLTRSCGAAKRMLGAAHTRDHTLTMRDYLHATGKRNLYWAQYAAWWWWSFGFADNWDERPAEKLRWKGGGRLMRVDSPEGLKLEARWLGHENEPAAKQGDLPWGA